MARFITATSTMDYLLPSELVALVETFSLAYESHWKTRITRDVLPALDKGWRLVGDGTCTGCYSGFCGYYGQPHEVYDWLSREQLIIEQKALLEPYAMGAEDTWVDPVVREGFEHHYMLREDRWVDPVARERHELMCMWGEDAWVEPEEESWGEWVEDVWCAYNGTFWRYIDGVFFEQEDW